MSQDIRSLLESLKKPLASPFLKSSILGHWRKTVDDHSYMDLDESLDRPLSNFLDHLTMSVVDAINPFNLIALLQKIDEGLAEESCRFEGLKSRMILPEEAEDLDPDKVSSLLSMLHSESMNITNKREELQHYVSILNKVIVYLDGYYKSIQDFILDESYFLPGMDDSMRIDELSSLAARERYIQRKLSDIKTLSNSFNENRKMLSKWIDDSLSSRNQYLMRVDSAIRLAVKSKEQDDFTNGLGSKRHTSPRPGDEVDPAKSELDPQGDGNVVGLED